MASYGISTLTAMNSLIHLPAEKKHANSLINILAKKSVYAANA
jgi:hypothetical protein